MPSRQTHVNFGTLVGISTATYRARSQNGICALAEILGGAVGGRLGGQLPDRIEPATSSYHRGPAHSYSAGAAMLSLGKSSVEWCESGCRAGAERFRQQRHESSDNWTRILYFFCEVALHFVAGAVTGAAAGYVSHLLLDARTPRGLPLIK